MVTTFLSVSEGGGGGGGGGGGSDSTDDWDAELSVNILGIPTLTS